MNGDIHAAGMSETYVKPCVLIQEVTFVAKLLQGHVVARRKWFVFISRYEIEPSPTGIVRRATNGVCSCKPGQSDETVCNLICHGFCLFV